MSQTSSWQDTLRKFGFGGLSGCGATLIVQPLDLIKTRLQLSGELGGARAHRSTLHAIANVVRTEGVLNMYNGLSAALFRQVTYTTTRMGVFQYLLSLSPDATFAHRIVYGALAGGVAGVVGNPAEVVLVRMTADGRLPPEQRRNYRHVGDALVRIVRSEGVPTLWRGVSATVSRAMLLNAAQLGSYSQAKAVLLRRGLFSDPSSIGLHTAAGMISGFACTVVSLPVDMAKTRVQQMRAGPDGRMPYTSALDCLRQVVRHEGVPALWKGFTPYFLRLGPHTVLSFIFLEQLNKAFSGGSGM
jgi:solute carrier family 25 oxoglutarate transporter 11